MVYSLPAVLVDDAIEDELDLGLDGSIRVYVRKSQRKGSLTCYAYPSFDEARLRENALAYVSADAIAKEKKSSNDALFRPSLGSVDSMLYRGRLHRVPRGYSLVVDINDILYMHTQSSKSAMDRDTKEPLKADPNTKEPIMTTLNSIIHKNKTAATSAAYNEAGRLANLQLGKLASTRLPLMVRGYADSPIGHLVLANLASIAVEQMRPDDARLQTLTAAMRMQAYQGLLQTLDLDMILDELLETKDVKRALKHIGEHAKDLVPDLTPGDSID